MAEASAGGTRVIAEGFLLPESPRWHEGELYLSDWGAREILAFDLAGNGRHVARVEAFPFSFDFLPDGRMALLAGTTLSIHRPDGGFARHANLSGLSDKAWNEIVVDHEGRAFVNTIGFDFPGGAFAPGLVAAVAPDGRIEDVVGDVAFPNGMAITPANDALILAESYGSRLTRFPIGRDGRLGERQLFADLPGYHPDGISMDAEGAVWSADVPGRCCIRVLRDGTIAERVDVDRGCFACMLGGEDGRTLFILAADWAGPEAIGRGAPSGRLLAASVTVPHAGRP